MNDIKPCPFRHENGNCLPIGGFCTNMYTELCKTLCGLNDENTRLKFELSALREANRWVPVKERLPEKCGTYRVWVISKEFGVLGEIQDHYNSVKKEFGYKSMDWGIVTHWRPLPEGPEGCGKK